MASKNLFVREIFVPSIVQKSCEFTAGFPIASLTPGTMMLLVAYAFLQEKILGKSGEARNRGRFLVWTAVLTKANEAEEAKN